MRHAWRRASILFLALAIGLGASIAMLTGPGPANSLPDSATQPLAKGGASGFADSPELQNADQGARERLRQLESRIDKLTGQVRSIAGIRKDFDKWLSCTRRIGVDRTGDPHHAWGYRFDEQDGTGIDLRPALVRHEGKKRPSWTLIDFSRRQGCITSRTRPNGTGAEARTIANQPDGRATLKRRARLLLHRMERMEESLQVSLRRFRVFDNWESCLIWFPLTESGDAAQGYGYMFDQSGERQYRPALDVDRGNWDDPDYQILAFRGKARPLQGARCGPGPGEGVDRVISRSESPHARRTQATGQSLSDLLLDVSQESSSLRDDIEDIRKDGIEFRHFDQCMFTIGITQFGAPTQHSGFKFVTSTGRNVLRPALAFDISGFRTPQFDVMAFPGEEPPQIECNEDAGGQETDE